MHFHLKKISVKPIISTIFTLLLSSILWVAVGDDVARAVEINRATRTVPFNDAGDQVTVSVKQFTTGQQKFNSNCAQCHLDGGTKTNPDVDLGAERLALATPPRNNIKSMIEYLENPTTYDGLTSLEELHPSLTRSDLFPKMRELTEDDLIAISSYILIQPKIVGEQWSGGKPNR